MALGANAQLAFPPLAVPMIDTRTGMVTQQWAMWFQQMYVRIGGSTPINPAIPSQSLASAYARNTFIDADGSITGTVGGLIYYYRSSIAVTTVIDSFTAQNTSGQTITLSAWAVPFGQTPSASNQLLSNLAIAKGANVTIPAFVGQELGSGAGIVLQASIGGVLLCQMTGRLLS